MKFNISQYSGNVAMHCPHKEQAITFLSYLDSIGKHWENGEFYSPSNTNWEKRMENTCYHFLNGTFGSIEFFRINEYTILEFEDFDWDDAFDHLISEEPMTFEEALYGIAADNQTTI